MIESCLFLPDNLMVILYEEQRLIQKLLDFPFIRTFPMFKTSTVFSKLLVLPPIEKNGLIIRPCGDGPNLNSENEVGFILGDAKLEGKKIILQLEDLKKKSDRPVFEKLQSKAWYYAKVEFTSQVQNNSSIWKILEKKWQKQN